MLKIVKKMADLDFGQLMTVYAESCGESLAAEQDFYGYLQEDFFRQPGAYYALWVVDGRYVSALRMESFRDGWLLTGLETAPNVRRKGYAGALLGGVLAMSNPGRIYSHVKKDNISSLFVHEKCGFQRISEQAVYLDGSADSHCCTLCFDKK